MDTREKLAHYGLYDPRFEHDACGVGFVCNINGKKTNHIIAQGLEEGLTVVTRDPAFAAYGVPTLFK